MLIFFMIIFPKLIYFLTIPKEKKEFIAYVMWKSLWIHPFFDYNWRTTRLFWELFLLQQWLPLTQFVWQSRNDFNNSMKEATNTWNLEKIIELI